MTWIVAIAAAAAIVIVVVVAALWIRRLRAQVVSEQRDLDDARRSTQHLETRVSTLRQELSEQHRANAELTAKLRGAGDARANGLWQLERLRQSRLAGTPTLPTANGPGMNVGADLGAAIALELELMREEVGTYAEVTGRGAVGISGPHVVNRDGGTELWMAFVSDPDGIPVGLMSEVPARSD